MDNEIRYSIYGHYKQGISIAGIIDIFKEYNLLGIDVKNIINNVEKELTNRGAM